MFSQFDNSYYSQLDGLTIGYTFSPLQADRFMDNLENNYIIRNNTIKYHIIYLDGCLVYIRGNANGAIHIQD